jgi:sarcosine oxidase/L-pipecolate oxidase
VAVDSKSSLQLRLDYLKTYSHTANTLSSAFKFLPVIGKYISAAMQRSLPSELLKKWKFPTEFREGFRDEVFAGDGSRGGPARRELTAKERATFDSALNLSSRQSKI